ncbi:MAG: D-alanyl-D-alanine carboxypeptidase, partial [Microbacteriaceae bacterium]|nr:D-alanyl-D-alanine carboxypeptidase [Microbacteriaceae bacterium]
PRFRRFVTVVVAASVLVSLAACAPERVVTPTSTPTPAATGSTAQADKPKSFFNTKTFSLDDPSSLWVVINKLRPFNPKNYAPTDLIEAPLAHANSPLLRKETADAMGTMFAAAKAEGAGDMQLQSAYRSYDAQVRVYGGYAASEGAAGADTHSARPGFSEHQTGLVADISSLPGKCVLAACFGQTPQGLWLAANAYRFGFLLRYPDDKTAVTGYVYEPWHFRYIGVSLATEMHTEGVETLEEFFGLPPAPNYAP